MRLKYKNKKPALCALVLAIFLPLASFAEPNKTHVTDSLSQGDGYLDFTLGYSTFTSDVGYIISGVNFGGKSRYYTAQMQAELVFGVTDNFNIFASMPIYQGGSLTQGISSAAQHTIDVTQNWSGYGDLSYGARYLLSDKETDGLGLRVHAIAKPANAPRATGIITTQTTANGTVTTPWHYGQGGTGTLDYTFGMALAPAQTYDLFFQANYTVRGTRVDLGREVAPGNVMDLAMGAEKMFGEKTTLTPSLNFVLTDNGYYGAYANSSYFETIFGMGLTHDFSKRFSIQGNAAYDMISTQVYSLPNGDLITMQNGSGMIFSLAVFLFF